MIKADLKDHPVKRVMAASTLHYKVAEFVCIQSHFMGSQEVRLLLPDHI